jgi:hypothetical protein
MPITVIFDFVIEMFYYILNNFTTETAKLSKGSDAKPRVKSFKGHDSRATEGTSKRLHTIGYRGVFYFQ